MTAADRALAITGIIGGAVAVVVGVPTLAVLLARRDTRTARRRAALTGVPILTPAQLLARVPAQRDRRAP